MDRRFGENDPSMNPEERMLERFTRERQMKSSKKSLFNLEDDEDTYGSGLGSGNVLTHSGQALSLNDDFDEGDLGISDEDDEAKRELAEIRKKRKRLADGEEIEEDGPKAKKSRDEIMKEVIAKSKMYKHERQMTKMEDQNEIDKLDEREAIDELMGELRGAGSFQRIETSEVVDKDEEYEKQVRMLAFDRRAKPSDRTKTEDEIAKDKAEKLLSLEQKRLARMNGEVGDESELDNSSDESESEEAETPEYGNVDEELNDAESFGLRSTKNDKAVATDDVSDEDVAGNYAIDSEFHDFPSDTEEVTVKPKKALKSKVSQDTAYTFECPESVSDLRKIFSHYPTSEQPVIVERILTLYHPSLKENNKEKISVFTNVLADYLLQAGNAKTTGDNDVVLVLDTLISQLRDLSEKHTESLSNFFREKLNEAESCLQASIESEKKVSRGQTCQSPSYLFLFTLIGLLFSTSDHFHQITTPASLMMGQHLSQNKVRSLADIFAGLYLCSTVLSYQRISKRYVPEVVQFLAKSISMLSPETVKSLPKDILVLQFEGDDITSKKFRRFATTAADLASSKAKRPLALREILGLEDGSKNTKMSARLYVQTCSLISQFSTFWNDKLAFIEMFGAFQFTPLISDKAAKQSVALSRKLEKLLKFAQQARVPLTLQAHRPIPIASNAPKFEENYSVDKVSYDPDQARQEISKLKAAVKKEHKGALRELRKDSQFMAREKIKTRRSDDSAYHEKMARLVRTVATEEGAEKNKYEREKQSRKRKGKN